MPFLSETHKNTAAGAKRFGSKKNGVRFMWIEHMTFRFVVPEVLLQSDALPTELNPQLIDEVRDVVEWI